MHFFYYEQDQANGKKNLVENLIYKQLAIILTFNLEPSFKITVHTSPIQIGKGESIYNLHKDSLHDQWYDL